MFVLLIVTGSKVFSGFVNDILSCLHFDLLNRKPSARDFIKNQSTRDCIDLVPFFSTHSVRVVSSSYFQMFVFATLRSLIFVRNNQGIASKKPNSIHFIYFLIEYFFSFWFLRKTIFLLQVSLVSTWNKCQTIISVVIQVLQITDRWVWLDQSQELLTYCLAL